MLERFRKKQQIKIRSEPQTFALSNADFKDYLNNSGYVPLSSNPEVRIAVDKQAELVSNMTIHLMKNTERGDKRVKNELSRKLDINPYKWMTRKAWIYKIVQDLLLYGDGNSIVFPKYSDGYLAELKPLNAKKITYHNTDDLDYFIKSGDTVYQSDEIMHFVINPDPDTPYKGMGYKVSLRQLVDNLSQAMETKKAFSSGQYMPNIIVKVDALTEELSSEEGREGVKNKFLKNKPGEPLIIPAELLEVQEIKPLTLKDIAINESAELDKRTVAGLLGVPSFFLGVGDFNKDEYNNFIDTRIASIANVISQTLTKNLLYSPDLYFKLNPRSLYAYNITDLVNAGTQMIDRNAMRRNELRDWIGLSPDDEMEELIILENYLPADKLGDQNKLKGGGNKNEE